MRLIFSIFFSLLIFISFAQKNNVQPALQKKYLPTEVSNLFLGMSVADLRKLRPTVSKPKDEFDINLIEKVKTGLVNEITYQFNPQDSSVSEFMIQYKKKTDAFKIAYKLFGKPNFVGDGFNERWKFDLADGMKIVIWIYNSKICILDNGDGTFR